MGDTQQPMDALLQRQERLAYGRVIHSLLTYASYSHQEIDRWESNYSRLPTAQQDLLPDFPTRISKARSGVDLNQNVLDAIVDVFDRPEQAGVPDHLSMARTAAAMYVQESLANQRVPGVDMDKVRYLLRNLVRDWAEEGQAERAACYDLIVQRMLDIFKHRDPQSPPHVLLPGAGLCRLACDLARHGFFVEANEHSFYMLLLSSLLLNHCHAAGQLAIAPYVLSGHNQREWQEQTREIVFPDAAPADIVPGPLLAISAGEFVEVYSKKDQESSVDAVVTCFFIDTAANVVDYLRVIHHVLRPSGWWLNFGPLLWHWQEQQQEAPNAMSLELSLGELRHAAAQLGFVLHHDESVTAPFMRDTRSMMRSAYECSFWAMRLTSKEAGGHVPVSQTPDGWGSAPQPPLPTGAQSSPPKGADESADAQGMEFVGGTDLAQQGGGTAAQRGAQGGEGDARGEDVVGYAQHKSVPGWQGQPDDSGDPPSG